MRYVRDTTHRFHQRPHYEMDELDEACEHIIRISDTVLPDKGRKEVVSPNLGQFYT